jgi:hypothetical protein
MFFLSQGDGRKELFLFNTSYPCLRQAGLGLGSLFWDFDFVVKLVLESSFKIDSHIELVLSYSFTCKFRISHPNFASFWFCSDAKEPKNDFIMERKPSFSVPNNNSRRVHNIRTSKA